MPSDLKQPLTAASRIKLATYLLALAKDLKIEPRYKDLNDPTTISLLLSKPQLPFFIEEISLNVLNNEGLCAALKLYLS